MHRRSCWHFLLVPALLLAVPAAAQNPSAATCMGSGCHDDLTTDEKHSPKVACKDCHPNVVGETEEDHADALSEHGPEVMCATSGCHPAVQSHLEEGFHSDSACESCHGYVHDEFQTFDPTTCRSCHKEAVTGFTGSVHEQEVPCGECHGDSHSPLLVAKNPLAPMSKVMQPESCVACHDDPKIRAFRTSVHGRALLSAGLDVAPTCSTCHGAHDMKPVEDPASPVFAQNVSQTCGSCHKFILSAVQQSIHATATPEEGRQMPVCSTCHDPHGTLRMDVDQNRLATPEACRECHQSQYDSYRHSFHGKATQLGLPESATCTDCHSAHRMLPKEDPHSTVHPQNLAATCGKCHDDVNESFLTFMPHANPANKADSAALHYVWLFMTTLLVGTIGFFAIHTALWTQRSVVGWFRGEFHHPENTSGKWVRRFKPIHIYLHLVIILTFLALAFTGLPLKFASEAWAAPLASFVGGLGGARWLHRVAGVLTFGYGLVFVGYLFREIVVRKKRSLLFGWQSMTPNKKDASDLVGNLKWFLYLDQRPKFDRWAYWEKFDFFAVFWGVIVIGLSGLVLWFPVAASKIIPGWGLNIAYVVHSDEALLATGFIFFFHFFHTHLRPESFPLDPVIFTGSMPLERFKEERPAEYERLSASGELEKYLVPPPSERLVNFAHAFGFSALAIGVMLGLALLASGLGMVLTYLGAGS